jgi:hypothetical protein
MVKDRELTIETTAGVGVVYMILAIATTYAAPYPGASTLRIVFVVVGVIFAAIAIVSGLVRGGKKKAASAA